MRREEIKGRLPEVFERTADNPGKPLSVLLDVMEALHAPSEAALEELDRYFDPRRAPDPFVPFLAWWVDFGWLLFEDPDAVDAPLRPYPGGLGRLREVTAGAAAMAKWRGTKMGLVGLLEAATGTPGFTVDEDLRDEAGRPLSFRIKVHAPEAARPLADLIRRIAEHEKPAHVVLDPEIVFA
jgi:phage tail-like protein